MSLVFLFYFRNYHDEDPSDKGIFAVVKETEDNVPPEALFRMIYDTWPSDSDSNKRFNFFSSAWVPSENFTLENPNPDIPGID